MANYGPEQRDMSIELVLERAFPFCKYGHKVFVMWTCPECGDRVTATKKITYGYQPGDTKPTMAVPFYHRHGERIPGVNCNTSVDTSKYKFGYHVEIVGELAGLFEDNDTNMTFAEMTEDEKRSTSR